MRCFWEQTGVLGPIYRLLGQGLNDGDIAIKLDLTEVKVQSWVAWILHFLNLKTRQELVLYASGAAKLCLSPERLQIENQSTEMSLGAGSLPHSLAHSSICTGL